MASRDLNIEKTSDIVPLKSYAVEFAAWVRGARQPDLPKVQDPMTELLGEHHIMDAVLAAMEREARRLSVHGDLRPDYWEDVVDFIGNFIHQVHRRKEEEAFFPALLAAGEGGEDETVRSIAKDHEDAKQLTLDLLDGVSDGDWEKVLRAAHLYLRVARDHLLREEMYVFEPSKIILSDAARSELRASFDRLETQGLGDRDRAYYLRLARKLCVEAGLTDLLES